jgi:hypothetical protein
MADRITSKRKGGSRAVSIRRFDKCPDVTPYRREHLPSSAFTPSRAMAVEDYVIVPVDEVIDGFNFRILGICRKGITATKAKLSNLFIL